MSGYVEVMVKGNCRAYISGSTIAGLIMPPGMSGDVQVPADSPMSILLNSGEVVEGVYGISANRLLLYVEGVKVLQREKGRLCVVAYLDHHAALEEQIEAWIAREEQRHG